MKYFYLVYLGVELLLLFMIMSNGLAQINGIEMIDTERNLPAKKHFYAVLRSLFTECILFIMATLCLALYATIRCNVSLLSGATILQFVALVTSATSDRIDCGPVTLLLGVSVAFSCIFNDVMSKWSNIQQNGEFFDVTT